MRLLLPTYSFFTHCWEEVCTYRGYSKPDITVKELESKKPSHRFVSAKTLLGTAAVIVALWALYYENFFQPMPSPITPRYLFLFPIGIVVIGLAVTSPMHKNINSLTYKIRKDLNTIGKDLNTIGKDLNTHTRTLRRVKAEHEESKETLAKLKFETEAKHKWVIEVLDELHQTFIEEEENLKTTYALQSSFIEAGPYWGRGYLYRI